MSRAERSARNKRVHAIRRALTDWIYADEREHGGTWRDVADIVAAIPADEILASYAWTLDGEPVPVESPATPRKRQAPAHVQAAASAYRLARLAWESQREAAMAGARSDGPRCKCSDDCGDWTEDECRFRREHPAPTYKEVLAAYYAERRALQGEAELAGGDA